MIYLSKFPINFESRYFPLSEDLIKLQAAKEAEAEAALIAYEKSNPVRYNSDASDNEDEDDKVKEEETNQADLGGGWGRIIFPPVQRGRQVSVDVCRSTKRDGSEGSFEHMVLTRSKNPTLHRLAKKSFWGDLWPF